MTEQTPPSSASTPEIKTANQRGAARLAAWELSNKKDVPVAVIVTEYVDVARAFFDGDEPKIVNAVLDRLARKYRDDQKPNKD